jgi:Heavy-metal resistance protein CzcE
MSITQLYSSGEGRMKLKSNCFATFAGGVAAFIYISTASAMGIPVDRDFGSVSEEKYANRVITIAPDAKWVNVTQDEIIKFVDAATGKSFAWTFDTIVRVFDLGSVAPDGILSGHHVDAYVAVNPRKSNNN